MEIVESVRLTVYPVLTIKDACNDTRSEGSGRIQTTAGVVHADEFTDKESETDADGCDEGG
jgi:hypothetical protein